MSFDTLSENLFLIDGLGNKWLKGTVVQNVDPKNLDRIQVSIPGLYDPDLGDVPWCGPVKLSPFGFGSGYGVFGTPVIGSDVAVTLQGGDQHYPLYMHIQCFANPDEFPSGQAWGFKDLQGNKLVVAGKDIQFQSGGGFMVHIDQDGNITTTVPAGKTATFNVPHVVWNVTDYKINATHDIDFVTAETFTVTGAANINGVTIAAGTGNVMMPGNLVVSLLATFNTLVDFNAGFNLTGPAIANGVNIGSTHFHTGGTHTGGFTGVPV